MHCMDPEGSLPISQEPVNDSNTELIESDHILIFCLYNIYYNVFTILVTIDGVWISNWIY
jgi:hypothetical protein